MKKVIAIFIKFIEVILTICVFGAVFDYYDIDKLDLDSWVKVAFIIMIYLWCVYLLNLIIGKIVDQKIFHKNKKVIDNSNKLRVGQIVFNSMYEKYPNEVSKVISMYKDANCYYNDNKVNAFIQKLNKIINENERK